MEDRMSSVGSSTILIMACLSFLVLVAGVGAIYFIAITRKAQDAVKEKPRNLRALTTPMTYSDAINRLLQAAPAQGYKVEDVTPDGSRVILSTPITFLSYGFFYPIYFSAVPGGTMVEVGIASRALQWGPVVTHNLDKITNVVGNAILAYPPVYNAQPQYGQQPPSAQYPGQLPQAQNQPYPYPPSPGAPAAPGAPTRPTGNEPPHTG
jgi:hypothetical protein